MRKTTENDEVDQLSLPFPVVLFPVESRLWVMGTLGLSLCLCCLDLCDAVMHAGCRSLCSTCYTSLCTPFPTVDSCLCPSGFQDLDPLAHMVPCPVAEAFVHLGCGSCSHLANETATCTVLRPLLPPSRLPCRREGYVETLSAGTRTISNGSGTLSESVHNCVHCVGSKENEDKYVHGNVTESGTGWENKSKTWILIWIWTGIGSKENG